MNYHGIQDLRCQLRRMDDAQLMACVADAIDRYILRRSEYRNADMFREMAEELEERARDAEGS